jgi:hypothetical protein
VAFLFLAWRPARPLFIFFIPVIATLFQAQKIGLQRLDAPL